MALINGVHHIALKCSDTAQYEKTIQFYRDVLGLEVVRTWDTGIMIAAGSSLFEIFNTGDAPLGLGVYRHIALTTDDVDACVKAVKAAGYEVFIEPTDIVIASTPEFPARMAFCYGPLGEEIEFFQER